MKQTISKDDKVLGATKAVMEATTKKQLQEAVDVLFEESYKQGFFDCIKQSNGF